MVMVFTIASCVFVFDLVFVFVYRFMDDILPEARD